MFKFRSLHSNVILTLWLAIALVSGASVVHAADKPLFELDNETIDARIRATFTDPDAFAAAKVVGQLFADKVDVEGKQIARETILGGLEKESARFRELMPDFHIEQRGLFVANNGLVMSGRMVGTRSDGGKMNTTFATLFTRDKSGRIVTQTTIEEAHK